MSFEQGFVSARDDTRGMAGEIGSITRRVAPDPAQPDGAPQSRSRVAAVPLPGLGRHDQRPQFRSRRVDSGAYARTSHFIISGKRMMNPSRFGIRTLGNVSALSVSFSPMSLFAAKM
jgi:hypothetical protein